MRLRPSRDRGTHACVVLALVSSAQIKKKNNKKKMVALGRDRILYFWRGDVMHQRCTCSTLLSAAPRKLNNFVTHVLVSWRVARSCGTLPQRSVIIMNTRPSRVPTGSFTGNLPPCSAGLDLRLVSACGGKRARTSNCGLIHDA